MKTSYSAAEARNEFSQVLTHVTVGGHSVVIERYGQPVAKIVPFEKRLSGENLDNLIKKYHGIWAGKSWAKDVGKPSRHFRRFPNLQLYKSRRSETV